jgi:arsenite methyltransferase
MQRLKNEEIRQAVRENYGAVARAGDTDCGCTTSSCCGSEETATSADISVSLGYSEDEMASVPDGANMGLGCGNPQAIASLKPGETVLDLGSGGGFDCFLAARAVGKSGHVIGVDMTPEMLSKAREISAEGGFDHVEFRLGEIEHLPVADNTVDVILSNCVINLSPDKPKVFQESIRVLKHGGRLAVSDVVATKELPDSARKDLALLTGCVSGASPIDVLKAMLEEAGFTGIRINPKDESREFIRNWSSTMKIEDFVVSATIEAVKP